jgi:hypothetical protein
VTNHKSTAPNLPKNLNASSNRRRTASLEDIEETETGLWVDDQLSSIRDFLVAHAAESEMLDAVDYLREDNQRWINPEIAQDLRAGRLHSGEA